MYDAHDRRVNDQLSLRVESKLVDLRARDEIDIGSLKDTRPIHRFFFERIVLPQFFHYVGNYRGSAPLANKRIQFGKPPIEGSAPENVADDIDKLKMIINSGIRMIKSSGVSDRTAVRLNYATLAAKVVSFFIRIHPYMDGNGHISRYLAIAILVPLGFTPNEWVIHPRPDVDSYAKGMIEAVKNDNLDELVSFL